MDCTHEDQRLSFEYDLDANGRLIKLAGSAHWDCDICGVTFFGPLIAFDADLAAEAVAA